MIIMKNLKKIIALFVFAIAALVVTSCGAAVKTYTVTYYVEDANGIDSVFASEKVEEGKMASEPHSKPTKNGYVFNYWTIENATNEYDWNKPVNADLGLHASFTKTYSVVFSANGHGTINGNKIYTRQNVSSVPNDVIVTPESNLFTFKGWYTDAACTDSNKVEVNATLTSTYGDTLNASLGAVYNYDKEDSSKFHYSISDADNTILSNYGISYSPITEGGINKGIRFHSTGITNVTTSTVQITVKITDDNKPGFEQPCVITLDLKPKAVTIVPESVKNSTGVSSPYKDYDGNQLIDVTPSASLDGIINNDNVTVSFDSSATLDSANAGSGKDVTLTTVTLGGTDSAKYTIDGTVTVPGIGTINQKLLTIEMELMTGQNDTIKFGMETPKYILKLSDDSIAKLTATDQAQYAAMDSTAFIEQYLGFTGWSTGRKLYSMPGTYTIIPNIDSTGKNYTATASGLSKSFTVTRDDGTAEHILQGTLVNGYYKGLSIKPDTSKNYDKIRLIPGGSDITGAILAAAVNADIYENFTDVDSVYPCDPRIVPEVKGGEGIPTMTYREMRELAYAGFGVFNDDAVIPAVKARIPINIRNTNHPSEPGTMIVQSRRVVPGTVVGIASADGFCNIVVEKYLMNREIGFGRRLLQILEEAGISYEHMPSGVDSQCVVVKDQFLPKETERKVVARIRAELAPDFVTVERDLTMLMVVGEGMCYTPGMLAKACLALASAGISMSMVNQGSSEVSFMLAIRTADRDGAVRALYRAFFG